MTTKQLLTLTITFKRLKKECRKNTFSKGYHLVVVVVFAVGVVAVIINKQKFVNPKLHQSVTNNFVSHVQWLENSTHDERLWV